MAPKCPISRTYPSGTALHIVLSGPTKRLLMQFTLSLLSHSTYPFIMCISSIPPQHNLNNAKSLTLIYGANQKTGRQRIIQMRRKFPFGPIACPSASGLREGRIRQQTIIYKLHCSPLSVCVWVGLSCGYLGQIAIHSSFHSPPVL